MEIKTDSQTYHSTNPMVKPVIDWESLLESRTWLTAQNVRVPISEMSTSHLTNTIACLKGKSTNTIPHNWNGKTHSRWLQLMEAELTRRQ